MNTKDFNEILKQNYIKILYVNLKTKEHEDIYLRDEERERGEKAYSSDIEKWLSDFADKANIHEEDISYYRQNTNIEFLRQYFKNNDRPFRITYRRRNNNDYNWVEMVIMKSERYTDENPIVLLYVMDTERFITPVALENQGIFDCFNIVTHRTGREAIVELLKFLSLFYKADDVFVCGENNRIRYEYQTKHIKSLDEVYYGEMPVNDKLRLIVVNPSEMKDNHILFRCVALIIQRVILDEEIEHKYAVEKRQNRIINALSKRFFTLYRVDLSNDGAYMVYAPDYVKNLLGKNRGAKTCLDIIEKNLVHEDYYERVHEFNDYTKWSEKLQGKETISIEFKGVNRWSRVVIIAATRDEDENVTEVLYGVQDIEEQKLREAEQDFKLREALKRANEASQAKSVFLSNMSHDIRTPMNAIVGFCDLAKENIDDKETVRDYLEEISLAGNHLVSLINDVLDMSHIESGKMKLNPVDTDVVYVLENIKSVMEMNLKQNNISLELNIGDVPHKKISCDEIKLNQILYNIIGNSAKYNKKDGYIKVFCNEKPADDPKKGIYEFIVEDSGIGMSKEFLEKVFDTFERERNTTTSGIQGTGLGMAITKALVELMEGEIIIDSKKGVGTTCTIRIPFFYVEDSHTENTNSEKSKEEIIESIKDTRVLLAEDNLVNRKLCEAIFKGIGISLEMVVNGKEALETVRERGGDFDVILMDMQMPVMNGLEATEAIRALSDKAYSNIPIIMMTANVFEEDKKRAYEIGANGYVTKPIDVEALVRELQKVLNNNTGGKMLVNKEEGLKLSYGSEELYESIVDAYIEESEEYKDNLTKFLSDKNWREYTVIAHAIKSNSKQIGANELFEEALKMEMAGKEENESYITENHPLFIEHYEEVLLYLKNTK